MPKYGDLLVRIFKVKCFSFNGGCVCALLLLGSLSCIWGADSTNTARQPVTTITATDSSVVKRHISKNTHKPIPYPFRTMHLDRGIVVSISVGPNEYSGKELDNAFLLQWEGEGSFFYTPYLSGGGVFKITAGTPNDSSLEVENRYQLFVRVHKRYNRVSFFTGPLVGVHVLDYQTDSSGGRRDNVTPTQGINHIDQQNLVYGLESGMGWLPINTVGAYTGLKLEHSWGREALVRFSGGTAYNLNELVKEENQMARGFFFHIEYQFTLVNDWEFPARKTESVWHFGLSVAF